MTIGLQLRGYNSLIDPDEVNVLSQNVIASVLSALILSTSAWGQQERRQAPLIASPFPPATTAPVDPGVAEMQRRMMKQMNKERFDHIKKDTDQLLALATELKKSVDQANDQMLSLEVVRKAEQIEKLARSVKEKMKGN